MASSPRNGNVFRRALLILYWIAIFVATHVPKIPSFVPQIANIDLAAHFVMYGGWAALWWWLLSAGRRRVRPATFAKLTAGGAVYGMFDEITQQIVGRNPSVTDFLANLAGIITVLIILQTWSRRRT